MAINRNRGILGSPNPFDNGLPAVTATDGGSDALDAARASGPGGVTDQSSAEFQPRADENEQAFRQAQAAALGVVDAGAPGARVAAAGQLVTQGSVPANTLGPADVVAPEGNNLALRSDGADSGTDGTGKAIG